MIKITNSNNEEQNIQMLLHLARNSEHTKFMLLRSSQEYYAARKCKKALKSAAKMFLKLSNYTYTNYLSPVIKKDIQIVAVYNEFTNAANYFKDELTIVNNIISEYRCYLRWGHFLKLSVFHFERPETDLYD